MKLTIVGAGYVGLVTSTCFAEMGHQVICLDNNSEKIDQLNRGECPIYEPQLQTLIQQNQLAQLLKFTDKSEEAYRNADLIFIAVGTPEQENGAADLTAVFAVAQQIKQHVTKDCIVVMKSTVPVGTNMQLAEQLAQATVKLTLVSNPEFLREGSAIEDFFHGDRIVIGTTEQAAIETVTELYAPLNQPIVVTSPKSAEMAKYASNAFLATKISFINEIANLCEMVGADVDEVADCMGLDKRIGASFLQAGIGYGGSCFPKDTKALIQIAGNVAYDFELLKSVVQVNQQQLERFMSKIKQHVPQLENKKIAVLGVAFKPNTDDIREAPAIAILEVLLAQGARVMAYDPAALANVKRQFGDRISYTEEITEAIIDADLTIILTEWRQIIELDAKHFLTMRRPLIIDGRNCLQIEELLTHGIMYEAVGRFVPRVANYEATS